MPRRRGATREPPRLGSDGLHGNRAGAGCRSCSGPAGRQTPARDRIFQMCCNACLFAALRGARSRDCRPRERDAPLHTLRAVPSRSSAGTPRRSTLGRCAADSGQQLRSRRSTAAEAPHREARTEPSWWPAAVGTDGWTSSSANRRSRFSGDAPTPGSRPRCGWPSAAAATSSQVLAQSDR